MKTGSRLSFALFLFSFTAACVAFALISLSFCKWSASDAATNIQDTPSLPVIIIDAGHGGEDGGAVSKNGTLEKDLNLSISKKLCDIFKAAGYEVVMTRETDTMLYDKNADYKGRKKELDLGKRVEIANSYENAIFISIHMNSFPDAKYSGLQVYYSKNHPGSAEVAENIQSTVRDALQKENGRQIKPAGQNIFVLDRIRIPAVLIECGFLSNAHECQKLSEEEYQKKLSLAIFLSVSKYIDKIP